MDKRTKINVADSGIIPSGINLNGLHDLKKGGLTVINGRPGCGKSTLSLIMACNLTDFYQIPVAYFSLEMNRQALENRISRLKNDEFLSQHLLVADKQSDRKIVIDDTYPMTPETIRAKCREYIARYGIQVIYIDCLQLLNIENSSATEMDVSVTELLKSIAQELNIAIVALKQQSRIEDTFAEQSCSAVDNYFSLTTTWFSAVKR
jgi:replicative DNA helicase